MSTVGHAEDGIMAAAHSPTLASFRATRRKPKGCCPLVIWMNSFGSFLARQTVQRWMTVPWMAVAPFWIQTRRRTVASVDEVVSFPSIIYMTPKARPHAWQWVQGNHSIMVTNTTATRGGGGAPSFGWMKTAELQRALYSFFIFQGVRTSIMLI